MRLSYNWLKDFVKIDLTPAQLADKLTMLGFEIEKIEGAVACPAGVVVGQIKEVLPHPNADRLRITKVDVGGEILKIVCGAPNIAVGQKVPVALVGAKLTAGGQTIEIKASVIRGESSDGMLCAADELGLGDDHTGIMILDEKATLGRPLAEGLDSPRCASRSGSPCGRDGGDAVYEFDVPANRGDVWSHLGMAREVAAVLNQKIKFKIPAVDYLDKNNALHVKISAPELCPKYLARVIGNLKIKPSPKWLQERLQACGVRSINNVVDVTNYVMLEVGQPLHAFDRRLIEGDTIEVRTAHEGEKMMTLDEKERLLTTEMLLITNGKKPLALAGIMGGEDSGIKDDTTEIVLESAQFNRVNILKTSRALGLRSESSSRFERGIDWQVSELALARATQLLTKLAGGEVRQTVEVGADGCATQCGPMCCAGGADGCATQGAEGGHKLELSMSLLQKLLGIAIGASEAAGYLKRLGFEILSKNKNGLSVGVPSWRQDILAPVDLVEEVGRLYGYEKFEPRNLVQELCPLSAPRWYQLRAAVRRTLVSCGFDEVYNYSFNGAENPAAAVEVLNPLNPEQKYLRTDLSVRLRENLELNLRNFDQVAIFEIGRVFESNAEELPVEKVKLGLAVGGYGKLKENFAVLKSALDILRSAWPVDEEVWGRALNLDNLKVGDKGLLWEIDLDLLATATPNKPRYQTTSQYPLVNRDLAIVIPKTARYAEIQKTILSCDPLIRRAELFDVFEHEKIGADKRSLALHLSFQASDHTLTMEEAETVFARILARLKADFGAEIRG